MARLTTLFRRTKNAPKQQGVKNRQRIDKAFDTITDPNSEYFQRLSPDAQKKLLQAKENLSKMSPAERKRFYAENSIWIAKVFNYREVDEEGNETPEFVGKNQLGKKVNALLRATQKQYTLNDMKQLTKYRAKKSSVKRSRPKKMTSPKLTIQDVDKQIADLERQLEQLKQIRAGL